MAYGNLLRNSLLTRGSPFGGGTDVERDPITGEVLPGTPDGGGTPGVPLEQGLDIRPPGPPGDDWDSDGGSNVPDPGGPGGPSAPPTPEGPSMLDRLNRARKRRSFYEPAWFGSEQAYDQPFQQWASSMPYEMGGFQLGGAVPEIDTPASLGPYQDALRKTTRSRMAYEPGTQNDRLADFGMGRLTGYGTGALQDYGVGALYRRR